jgi:hypothetical protein
MDAVWALFADLWLLQVDQSAYIYAYLKWGFTTS